MKTYNDIQEAGQELFQGKYGCQALFETNFVSTPMYEQLRANTLSKQFPNGQKVETLHGNYWIWPTE